MLPEKQKRKVRFTKKELVFCHKLLQGVQTLQAFKDAGYSTNGNGWQVNAYQLAASRKIKDKLAEMQTEFRDLDTVDDYVPNLKKLREIRDTGAHREALQAMKLLNDMKGYNQPKKVEVQQEHNFKIGFNTAKDPNEDKVIDITENQIGKLPQHIEDAVFELAVEEDLSDEEFYKRVNESKEDDDGTND